jgi:hypothetical protein
MRRKLGSTTVRGPRILVCGVVSVAMTTGAFTTASNGRAMRTASAARTITLSETAHLEPGKQEVPGSEISESGRATGTYNAPVIAGLTIHAHSVRSVVTVFLKGGAITATANANFEVTGVVGNFHGTLTVSHATGTYRHASGHLSFRGAINRDTLKMWAVTSGSAKY